MSPGRTPLWKEGLSAESLRKGEVWCLVGGERGKEDIGTTSKNIQYVERKTGAQNFIAHDSFKTIMRNS